MLFLTFSCGQDTAPAYNLGNIDISLHLFVGDYDKIDDSDDTQDLLAALTGSSQVDVKNYPAGHMTFVWAKDISFFFNDLIEVITSN